MKGPLLPTNTLHHSDAPVVCRIASRSNALRRLREDSRSMVVVEFGVDGLGSLDRDPRRIRVPLKRLEGGDEAELWLSPTEVQSGLEGDVAYARNPETLLVWTWIPEDRRGELEASVERVYADLMSFITGHGYKYPFRTWTYLNDITGAEGPLNRYQAFCKGRFEGMRGFGHPPLLPAATVIGSRVPGMLVYMLTGRDPGHQLENPRQVSAFRYPERYGPQSPSFSRAVIKPWGAGGSAQLYISGTASIVGHESVHQADLLRQLDEILRNLQTLVSPPGRERLPGLNSLADLSALKVYLRDEQDLGTVAEVLRGRLGTAIPVLFLHGDVCRDELLLEIEALYTP